MADLMELLAYLKDPAGAASIAAVGAVLAAGTTFLAAAFVAFSGRRWSKRDRRAEFRLRQLTDLYGPLYMQRMTGLRLWLLLTAGLEVPGEWRLVDHIEEIKAEVSDRRRHIVETILELNRQSVEVLNRNAALLFTFPPDECFLEFMDHALTVQQLWDEGLNRGDAHFLPYPVAINDELKRHIDIIRNDIA